LLQPRFQLFGDIGMRGQAIFKFRVCPTYLTASGG
jgi:hypothetical protein